MYKLMLVEDEPLIRMGLKHYFSWQELNVSTIVEAENGVDGLAMAIREQPDLVITDIRMPEMNGLQMIEQIRRVLPDTIFIILSGFSDFEYTQKAIQLGGVHDFLLKPLEYEHSLKTIQECMKKVEDRRSELHNRSELEREAKESWTLKGSQLVKLLLEDEHAVIDEDNIKPIYEFESDNYVYQPFVITALPHDTSYPLPRKWLRELTEREIKKAIDSLFQESTPYQVLTYVYKSKLYGLVIIDSNLNTEIEQHMQEQLDSILKRNNTEHQLFLFMAIGNRTNDLMKVGELLHHTDKALYQRFYQPDQYLFLNSSLGVAIPTAKAQPFVQLSDNDKKAIVSCMESANELETQQLMLRFAQTISTAVSLSSPEKWLAFLQEIISVTIRFANKNDIHIEGVYSDKLLNLTCVDDFPTIEALFEWLARWMIHLGQVYNAGTTENNQDALVFVHIEEFIKQHIDQDVSLQMVADRFFYNPSYLSRLFKKKLNKNYMRFVTEIRIGYAQEFLKKPDYLITDVCTMCGYKSYKHFVKTFRSITDMTPTDYRKQSGW